MKIINSIKFPEFTGLKCNMMPYIQGCSSSLPEEYQNYANIIDTNYLKKGKIGFLTIDESFVDAGKSQRGYNNKNIDRNVHIEVGMNIEKQYCWGGGDDSPTWGGNGKVILKEDTEVLIANSISDTCKFWNVKEKSFTKDGDLSDYIDKYPSSSGISLKAGEVAKISIFTPHECINQKHSGNRQFFRIVGDGVLGREDYFTKNPLINFN